ncbi:hypothetical protein B0H13DRAFT_2294942 [Mycena leptocephala]|nr:hypothetical protein B0H13DRAFT_2294942 [Mycena leptocephala]
MSFGNGAHVSGGTWTHVAGNMNMTAVTSSNSALVAAPASQQPIVSARGSVGPATGEIGPHRGARQGRALHMPYGMLQPAFFYGES